MHLDEKSPFQDIRVRKAVGYAIDKKTITEKLFLGFTKPYGDIVAPYEPGHDPKRAANPQPYDPEKAKKLLAEAGYPNGFDTT